MLRIFLMFLFLIFGFVSLVFPSEVNSFFGFDYGYMLGLSIPFISGLEGSSILGSEKLELGASNVYFGIFDNPNAAGTVSVVANSPNVTGTGTTFLTLFKIGDWVTIAGVTKPLQIKSITSDTALVLMTNVTSAVTSATFKKVQCIDLGTYDKLDFKLGVKKVELKDAQGGDNPSDKVITGYTCEISFGMARTALARLGFTLQGFKIVRDTVTGKIKGAGFGFAIGTRDTDDGVLGQLLIVKLVKGVESTDPLDTVKVLRCAPNVEAEWSYDSGTQRFTKHMFNGYVDYNTTIDGVPMIAVMGDIS